MLLGGIAGAVIPGGFVVPYRAAGGRAQNGVVTCNVAGDAADGRTA